MTRKLTIIVALMSLFSAALMAGNYGTVKQQEMMNKLKNIIVDKVEFEDTDFRVVLKYLSKRSKELSKDKSKVNIVTILPKEMKDGNVPKINLHLTKIPLYDAIKYVAMSVNMDMHIEDFAIVLRPKPPKKK